MGVLRHVDAGYERAIEVARERGIRVPMLEDRPISADQAGASAAVRRRFADRRRRASVAGCVADRR